MPVSCVKVAGGAGAGRGGAWGEGEAARESVLGWLSAGVRQEVLRRVLSGPSSMDVKWQLIHLLGDGSTKEIDVTGGGQIFVEEVMDLYRSVTLALAINLTRLGLCCNMRSHRDRRYLPEINPTFYRTLARMTHLTWVTLAGVADTAIMATLGAKCPHLAYLDVSGSPRLTDQGVAALLAQNHESLAGLSVREVAIVHVTPTQCCAKLGWVCVADTEVGLAGGVLLMRCLPRLTSLGGYLGEGYPFTAVLAALQPYHGGSSNSSSNSSSSSNSNSSSCSSTCSGGGVWQCGVTAVWQSRVSASQAAMLCQTCPALTTFTTEDCSIPTLSLLPSLTSLTVDLQYWAGAGMLDYLMERGASLTHLSLTHAINCPIHIPTLVNAAPHLTHLQAALTLEPAWGSGWDSSVGEEEREDDREGEDEQFQDGGTNKYEEVWENLVWAYISVTSVKAMVTLLTHTPVLTRLSLSLNPAPYSDTWQHINDSTISQVTALGGLRKIETLVIAECGGTISGIHTLIESCPNLTCLAPLLYWPLVTQDDLGQLQSKIQENNWILELLLRTVRRVGEGVGGDEVVSREDIVAQLTTLTAALVHVSPPHHQHHNPHYHHKALEVMEKVQGFRVYRAPSRLGGLGVVADTDGRSMVGVCGSVMASGSNGSAVAGLSDDSVAGLSGRQKSLWSASGNLKVSRSDGGLSGCLMAEMSTSCEGKTVTGVSDGNATAGVNGDSVLCASGRLMRDMSSKDKTNAPASSDSVLSECDGGAVVVRRGQLVALYPGTLYLPHQPIFFQSIANPFIFRCADGILIDGNDKRLSKFLYKSCCGRDRVGPLATADTSWLTPLPVNPLNIGQYINNQSSGRRSNVAYQEVTLQPDEVSVEERWLLPNLWYSPTTHTNTAPASAYCSHRCNY